MPENQVFTGYSENGLPLVRIPGGAGRLVVFEGLNFNHAPAAGMQLRQSINSYRSYASRFTLYLAGRKPGLPAGYSIREMADDYARMIEKEIPGTVDLLGLSTGGLIALQMVLDHPEKVRRLVLGSSGYALSREGAAAQRRVIEMVKQGQYRAAAAALGGVMSGGLARPFFIALMWLIGRTMFRSAGGPSDGLVELEAEDRFNCLSRLAEIHTPALVISGELDRFYPVRETGAAIPTARTVLIPRAGHMASMKKEFHQQVLEFLSAPEAGD